MQTRPAEPPKVTESRRGPRFIIDPPIRGTFDDLEIDIYNIGETGVQAEVPERLMRGKFGELHFVLPISPQVVRLQGRVTWVRQAKKNNLLQTWPYRCGIRVENIHTLTIGALAELLRRKLIRPDKHSLERKKQLLIQRQSDELPGESQSAEAQLPAPLTMDECIIRVQNARAILRGNPSLGVSALEGGKRRWAGPPESDELIALWQYLGRVVDPSLISVVLDLYPGA